ncbi:MAG TPA: hypothetical protein VG722_12300 [Tepidisphaeraceae bacterium]|nr:hypothetical protein [Tepidisphaeraceae bacterium]
MRYAILLALVMLAGCKATLESGYQPRPLNASDDTRRAYYAPAFSPESHVTDSNQRSPVQPIPTRSED